MKATMTGLLVLVGAAGFAVFGLRGFTKTVWTDDVTESISLDVAGANRMDINTHNGQIDYRGDDTAAPSVEVIKRGGGSTPEEAEAALEAIEIVQEYDGDAFRLYWRWKDGKSLNWRAHVAFDVTGPSSISLSTTTHNGSINIHSVTGDLRAQSHNGRIMAKEIAGSVESETHNGGITIAGRGARLQGETHNGSIDVTWVGEDVALSTHNGGVDADLSECAEVGGRIATHNGKVRVATGPATAFALDAESKRGKVETGVNLASGKATRNSASGSLNGGTQRLSISTNNGSIVILGSR